MEKTDYRLNEIEEGVTEVHLTDVGIKKYGLEGKFDTNSIDVDSALVGIFYSCPYMGEFLVNRYKQRVLEVEDEFDIMLSSVTPYQIEQSKNVMDRHDHFLTLDANEVILYTEILNKYNIWLINGNPDDFLDISDIYNKHGTDFIHILDVLYNVNKDDMSFSCTGSTNGTDGVAILYHPTHEDSVYINEEYARMCGRL